MSKKKWLQVVLKSIILQNRDTKGFTSKFFLAFFDAAGELGRYDLQNSMISLIEDFAAQA